MSRNTNLSNLGSLALTLAGALALSLGGCKKPPPPPPQGACCTPEGSCSVSLKEECGASWRLNGNCSPNPCPQPPPPEVSFETIAQNEKADARVQFAADLKISEENLDLGKAVVRLADCFARGSAKDLKPMLTRRAQSLLADLESSGQWEEATKQIEAVRVVFVRDGVDFTGIGSAKVPTAEISGNLMAKVMEAVKGIPPEQLAAITKAATEAMAGADRAALAADPAKLAEFQSKITEAMKTAGVSEEVMAKLADLGSAAGAPAEAAPSCPSGMGVALALQDIHGSYLLTWAAEKIGDKWVFTNAPASAEIRPRASLWDNVGNEAFQAMSLASLPAAPKLGDDAGAGGKGGAGGAGGDGGDPGAPGAPGPSSPTPSSPNPVPSIPGPTGKHPHG